MANRSLGAEQMILRRRDRPATPNALLGVTLVSGPLNTH